ncbi:hypothetical protein F2Q70_00011391 [Brassica cretica]|nr:hypothetical protein F2Q70_00011391 [Brassica cretica]KAF3543099.1 hypothetical protein DY000_02006621 [Brassica cretica]
MSISGSHRCRPIETDEHRSTCYTQHRSTEEVASCATVRILTHEEFAAKHPLLLRKTFMATVGAVCNMQTIQLCLILINPYVYYDPVRIVKPQTSKTGVNIRFIAACYCEFEAEYETKYEASIDSRVTHRSTLITHQIPRDPESQARAMHGRILNISKEDIAEVIAMNGPKKFMDTQNRVEDPPSINKTVAPSIDEQDTYSKAEVDELVADIYRAMRTADDYHSKSLDDVYYPFDNSISWLTTRTDEMKQDIAMIQEQHAVGAGASKSIAYHIQPSIDASTRTSIDANLRHSKIGYKHSPIGLMVSTTRSVMT